MNPSIPFLIVSLLLAGCASTTPMVLGPDHPANPKASAAPLAPPSATLALSSNPTTAHSIAATAPSHGAQGKHAEYGTSGTHHASGTGTPPASQRATSQPSTNARYTCTHHPEVVSDKPGKCPKCKMKLIKKGGGQ